MFLKVSEDGFMVKILLSVAIFAKNVYFWTFITEYWQKRLQFIANAATL